MIIHATPAHTAQYHLYRDVLMTLLNIAPPLNDHALPPPETWPTTRQISDAHDISIYKARLLLLDLVKHGLVIVSDGAVNNSLRWYPHDGPGPKQNS